MSDSDKQILQRNIIAGLPGSVESFSLQQFQEALDKYKSTRAEQLRDNLICFLEPIIPVAEACNVCIVIQPDDPPFPILGLPRVVSTASDIKSLIRAVPSLHNGQCFCTGSLGVRDDKDLPDMIAKFRDRINFIRLSSTKRNDKGCFFEDNQLEGEWVCMQW